MKKILFLGILFFVALSLQGQKLSEYLQGSWVSTSICSTNIDSSMNYYFVATFEKKWCEISSADDYGNFYQLSNTNYFADDQNNKISIKEPKVDAAKCNCGVKKSKTITYLVRRESDKNMTWIPEDFKLPSIYWERTVIANPGDTIVIDIQNKTLTIK